MNRINSKRFNRIFFILSALVISGCKPAHEYADTSIYSLLANPTDYSGSKVGIHGFLMRDDRGQWALYPNPRIAKYNNIENSITLGGSSIKEECLGDFVYSILTLKTFKGIHLETAHIETLTSHDQPAPHTGCLTSDTLN